MTAQDWQILRFTVEMALMSTGLLIPPGLALAWLLARRNWPGKALVETLVTLPMVLPPVATGLMLLQVFGRRGWVGGFLYKTVGLTIVFSWRAVVIALAVMSFPLFVRSAEVAFANVNKRYEQIAGTLGASPTRTFFTITLPLARGGLLGGTLLAFARALGEFGATIVLAGNIPGRTETLSLAIYQLVQLGEDDHALRLLTASLALSFASVAASRWLARTYQPGL